MNKPLDQLTNEELGHLVPIIITESNPDWIRLFGIEKTEIEKALGESNLVSIEHISSTAI